MSEFDDRARRFRAAVFDAAGRSDADALLERVRASDGRRRAVTVAAAAAVAAVVVAALAVVIPSLLRGPDGVVIAPPGEPEPAPPAQEEPTDEGTSSPAPDPNRIFALLEDRAAVAELDATTGEVVRELAEDAAGEGIADLSYSVARGSLIVTGGVTSCRVEATEVPPDDGPRRELGVGREVAVDAHGDRYAIARVVDEHCGDPSVTVEVVDFDAGPVHAWSVETEEEGPYALSHLTWSQDDRRLAFQLDFGDGSETRILDTDRRDTASLHEASTKLQPPLDRPVAWTAPAYRGGTLTVVEGPALGYEEEVDGWQIVEVDPESGQRGEAIVSSSRPVAHLDWDVGGHRLLYVEGGGDSQAPALRLWSDDAASDRLVREGVRQAVWGVAAPSESATAPEPNGCSTAGMSPELQLDDGLPEPVAERRRQIVEAAVACDNARLAELAAPDGFVYAHGEQGSPAAYWARAEDGGQPVLRRLVEVLRLPHALQGDAFWWPSAAVRPRDDADWDALERIYPADLVAEWRSSDLYLGGSVRIERDGTWRRYSSAD